MNDEADKATKAQLNPTDCTAAGPSQTPEFGWTDPGQLAAFHDPSETMRQVLLRDAAAAPLNSINSITQMRGMPPGLEEAVYGRGHAALAAAFEPFDNISRLTQSLGLSPAMKAAFEASGLGVSSELSAIAKITSAFGISSQLAEAMRPPDLGVLGAWSAAASLSTLPEILGLPPGLIDSYASPKRGLPESAFDHFNYITSLNRELGISSGIAAMVQGTALDRLHPAYDSYKAINHAIDGLPAWLRPASPLQALQPSWEVAAGLGLAGFGRPGLFHDALGAIYTERVQTRGFEAVVQMLEAADEGQAHLAERTISVLRAHIEEILDLLAQARGWIWINRNGLGVTVGLLIAITSYYESHLARLDSDDQTRLAHASATSQPSAAETEIVKQLEDLKRGFAEFEKAQTSDPNARIVVRTTMLRQTPDTKGTILREVYPDDRVHVSEVQGGWAKVDVYQYNSEMVIHGWMTRRALRLPDATSTFEPGNE